MSPVRVLRELDREPARIAILRARTGLGDLLCSVPALRALRARLPNAHIALITFAEMAPVVERQRSYVDELLPFPGWPGIPERPPRRREIAPFRALRALPGAPPAGRRLESRIERDDDAAAEAIRARHALADYVVVHP